MLYVVIFLALRTSIVLTDSHPFLRLGTFEGGVRRVSIFENVVKLSLGFFHFISTLSQILGLKSRNKIQIEFNLYCMLSIHKFIYKVFVQIPEFSYEYEWSYEFTHTHMNSKVFEVLRLLVVC